MTKCLVIADADDIQDYIFSTHELKLIRGGSSIQSRLMCDLRKVAVELNDGRQNAILRAIGGTVLSEFADDAAAKAFRGRARDLFRQRTGGATGVTFAQVEDEPEFADKIKKLVEEKLPEAKRLRTRADAIMASPFSASCSKCGMYPASDLITDDNAAVPVCLSCRLRTDEGGVAARYGLNTTNLPQSFEQIASGATPANYLAVVKIDIDRLGKFIHDHGSESKDAYRELSKNIDAQMKESTDAGIGATGAPCEVLLRGGDDVMVALPAGRLREFMTAFQKKYRENATCLPSFSAGAAIAHSHFPITEFRRIASDLVRSAKTVTDKNAIDYEIVTSSMAGDLVSERERPLKTTAKPYVLDEWLKFCCHVCQVKKGVPASQAKRLYEMTRASQMQACLEYAYLLGRLGERDCSALRKAVEGSGSSLWLTAEDGSAYTRAADLVELWDFMHAD